MPGAATSAIEVTNISAHGFWLFTHAGERFLAFDDFPWFRDAPVSAIANVEEPATGRYYWPDLDIDLNLSIIERPQNYPLRSMLPAAKTKS